MLVGVAIGYGIAQVLTDDSEPVTIEVPVEVEHLHEEPVEVENHILHQNHVMVEDTDKINLLHR